MSAEAEKCSNDGDHNEKPPFPSSPLYNSRLDGNGKNKNKIYCTRCPSLVLTPGNGGFIRKKFSLPSDKVKKSDPESEKDNKDAPEETIHDCWMIENMYAFENIGFSNTVGTIKYLVCADCESGPIGWHDLSNGGKISYLSWDRVKHSES